MSTEGPATTGWRVASERLENHFQDKKPAFDWGEALAETSRCLYCSDAPCIKACPTHIDIPTFIRKIGTRNVRGAARTILEANLLGKSCAQVCPVEVLCEGDCVYVGWGRKAIEIGRLQRFAMDNAQSADLFTRAPRNGRSVGHVGGGPASMACAGTLALLGYDAVIYEKTGLPGGLNISGVAPYKFQGEDALAEAQFIADLGVEFRMHVEIGADISAQELLARHDAVFIGVGLGGDSLRGVPGADGDGVIGALEWIESMKLAPGASVKDLRSVVVVGGGNTALDVAQEMAGLGVPQVRLVYRRGQNEMSGYAHEFEGAKKLRVQLVDCANVGAVARNAKGGIESVVLHKTINGQATDQVLDRFACDLVVVATGQERLQQLIQQFPGVTCDARGRVQADPATLATGNPRVFTGGDCQNGGKEVVNAADEGQRAARAIHTMLQEARTPA